MCGKTDYAGDILLTRKEFPGISTFGAEFLNERGVSSARSRQIGGSIVPVDRVDADHAFAAIERGARYGVILPRGSVWLYHQS